MEPHWTQMTMPIKTTAVAVRGDEKKVAQSMLKATSALPHAKKRKTSSAGSCNVKVRIPHKPAMPQMPAIIKQYCSKKKV